MTDYNIKGLNAIVTGATSGIGKAICEAFATEGVNIFAVGRNANKLAELTNSLVGVKTASIVADLGDLNAVKEVVPACVKALGSVNILINCAGVICTSDSTEEEWIQTINTDLSSLLILTKRALPEIEKNDRGVIINISSLVGRIGVKGFSACTTKIESISYLDSAAKHGVVGFSSSLFEDVREKNIKVCCIEPGYVKTAMVNDFGLNTDNMIMPEDIAKAVIFVSKFPNSSCPTEILILPQKNPFNKQ